MTDDDLVIENLRKELIKRLHISRQLLNYRINQKKTNIPLLIKRDDAIILLAMDENIPVDTLSKTKQNEINDILLKVKQYSSTIDTTSTQIIPSKESKKRKEVTKIKHQIVINFKDFNLENSNLPKKRVEEAKGMAEFYAYLYVFENSVRQFITEILGKKIGDDWWDKVISNRIKKEVETIMKKEKGKWVLRESHPIYYTTMGQLVTIIEGNWQDFENIFGDIQKLKNLIDPIEEARNPIAHSNYLSKDRQNLLKLQIKMWFNYLKEIE